MNRPLSTLAITAVLALGATHASAAPNFRIKVLEPTPHASSSQAMAISDGNVVVGMVQLRDGEEVAALWPADGGVQALGTLPGDQLSQALGVNGAGQVVGFSGYFNAPHAFIWDAVNGMQSIGNFDSANPDSTALGISDDGEVVGHAVTPDGALHAYTWTAAGGMVDVYPDAFGSEALAINRHGQWVGGILTRRGEAGVRVNAGGKRTRLGALDADKPSSYGNALNNLGSVVGSSVAADGNNHAFLWDKLHGMQDLGVLAGGSYSNAIGINDAGQVVGVSSGDASVPFYYDKRSGMVELAMLIADDDPLKNAVQLNSVQAINNRGVVVVNGQVTRPGHATPQTRALLLIPN